MVHGQANPGDTAMVDPALRDIGIIELLEYDTRPTIILDLQRLQHSNDELLHPFFSNASFKRLPPILDPAQLTWHAPADHDDLELYANFKRWATSSPTHAHTTDGYTAPFYYRNLSWTCLTLKKRWRIISGPATGLEDTSAALLSSLSGGPQKDGQNMSTASTGQRALKEKSKPQLSMYPTWVNQLPISEHIQFFKSVDWSATALGPLETWSDSLRQMTRLLMSDSRAAALFWYRPRFKWLNECR